MAHLQNGSRKPRSAAVSAAKKTKPQAGLHSGENGIARDEKRAWIDIYNHARSRWTASDREVDVTGLVGSLRSLRPAKPSRMTTHDIVDRNLKYERGNRMSFPLPIRPQSAGSRSRRLHPLLELGRLQGNVHLSQLMTRTRADSQTLDYFRRPEDRLAFFHSQPPVQTVTLIDKERRLDGARLREKGGERADRKKRARRRQRRGRKGGVLEMIAFYESKGRDWRGLPLAFNQREETYCAPKDRYSLRDIIESMPIRTPTIPSSTRPTTARGRTSTSPTSPFPSRPTSPRYAGRPVSARSAWACDTSTSVGRGSSHPVSRPLSAQRGARHDAMVPRVGAERVVEDERRHQAREESGRSEAARGEDVQVVCVADEGETDERDESDSLESWGLYESKRDLDTCERMLERRTNVNVYGLMFS
ncbi:unnamed protein product [Vitrella brassicaformis CCMP3155]|uniref:Uncharacterized protein n=2 Tax=Vitrella brassicaformis TaxID=1169539 RepID=A0A0G4EGY9_VITBC|nr:unnamed protein product [Vitrella brassicaformis CCMP3155]|eukprot:CEL94738.1 unnamed protein product [Vitrella brassicaformis CCMP3155]